MFTKFVKMKPERWPDQRCTSTDEDWDEADRWDAKDCWVLPDGELSAFMDAQQALTLAGYQIRSAEVVKTHPIWTFDVDQDKAPRCCSHRQLLCFLHKILLGAGLHCQREALIVQPVGSNRLILSILWAIPAREPRRSRAWQREQRRLQKSLEKAR